MTAPADAPPARPDHTALFPDALLAAAAAAAAAATSSATPPTTNTATATPASSSSPPNAPSSPPSPALLHSLHALTRRIATLSGVPDPEADAAASAAATAPSLPALHAQLQRLHDHLYTGRRGAARAARGAVARLSAGSLPWDDLDGVEDIRVDSEDEAIPVVEPVVRRKSSARRPRPPLPPTQRSSASLSAAPQPRPPKNLSQYSASSASQAVVVPLLSPTANTGGLPVLPDLPLDDDHPLGSARSSQMGGLGGGLDARPPSKLRLGSAANSYLTHMSSWKSLGHGAADRLHADYTKIFRRSADDASSTAPVESSIEIAGGDLYVSAPLAERWTIAHKIGEGGYATVRLATRTPCALGFLPAPHAAERSVAAVKIISKRSPENYNDRMVSREVFSFRLLEMAGNHENIVELYEVFEDDDNVYLVMELLEGGELFARIAERGQYTERDAAGLVVSMLASLAFCHRLNLTHRDVKPENFVFRNPDSDGVDVKLTDFGIAYYSEDPSALCKTLCGTPLYVAPEVLLRQPYGPEADLWSLGVIVHIMLVGYPPFDDNDLVQLVKKIKYRPVKFDGPEWALISEEGKQFVGNLLDKDASNRMNAQQALEHEWLRDNCRVATDNRLDEAQTNIRSFANRKRWRAAIQGVKAMNRLHHMMKEVPDYAETDDLDEISAEKVEVVVVRGSAERQMEPRRWSSSSSSSDERRDIPVRKLLENGNIRERGTGAVGGFERSNEDGMIPRNANGATDDRNRANGSGDVQFENSNEERNKQDALTHVNRTIDEKDEPDGNQISDVVNQKPNHMTTHDVNVNPSTEAAITGVMNGLNINDSHSDNTEPTIAKPQDQKRIPSAVTSRTITRSGSSNVQLAMDPAFESSDEEQEVTTAPKLTAESGQATSSGTGTGPGTATGQGMIIVVKETDPDSQYKSEGVDRIKTDDDTNRRRGLMSRSMSRKKRRKGGGTSIGTSAGGSTSASISVGASASGSAGGGGAGGSIGASSDVKSTFGRVSIGSPPSGRSSLGVQAGATGRASLGGPPSGSAVGQAEENARRGRRGATGAVGRMETSPHVGGTTAAGDEDSGRVGRTMSRFDGSVVRKMSSHARKLVGKGRRVFSGGGEAAATEERPPVMLQMGEHRKQKRGFAWFR